MANTLRFKRGLASGIPTALAGEPLFTTDTFDLYIGNGTTNTRFQKYIASGTTSQLLRGDGSLLTMPIVLTSPANGQVLKFNGTNWVNDSDAGITGSGAAGQVAYFTGATTQGGNNNLFWDTTNLRLGIGTNTPDSRLQVLTGGGSPTNQFRINFNNTNDNYIDAANHYFRSGNGSVNRLLINSTGHVGLAVTPTSWRSDAKVLQIENASFSSLLSQYTFVGQNWYNDAVNKYITNGRATLYQQLDGIHSWFYATNNTSGAGAALTLVESARIHNTGNFGIGTGATDSGQRLQVVGTGYFSTNLEFPNSGEHYVQNIASTTFIGLNFDTPYMRFAVNNSVRMFIASNGNVLIGSTTDSGEKLQVTGTMKVTGATSFGGAMTLSLNQNAATLFTISNTTSGTGSQAGIQFNSNSSGTASIGRYSSATTAYKTIAANDFYLYNGVSGDISILNDVTTGNIKFAAGASSTTQMLLNPSGNLGLGVTPSAFGSSYRGLQVGNSLTLMGASGASEIGANNFFNGTNYIYISNAQATLYAMSLGQHRWYNAITGTAGNAITFTQAMTLDASGRLGIGTTTTPRRLNLQQTTGGDAAMIGFYTQEPTLFAVMGAKNNTNDFQLAGIGNLIFYSGSTIGGVATEPTNERMRLFSTGNLVIASTTDSGERLQVTGTAKITGATAINAALTITNATLPSFKVNHTAAGHASGWFDTNEFGVLISSASTSASHYLTNMTSGGTSRFRVNCDGSTTITADTTIGLTSTTGYSLVVQNSGATDATGIRLTSGGTDNGYLITAYNSVSKYASLQAGDNTAYRAIILNALGGNVGIGMTPSYKLDVTGSARISDAIAIGTTPDTNNPFKILKNLNTTVGIKFENTNTSSLSFSAVQLGNDITGGTAFTNLVYGSSGITESGVYKPSGTALINTGSGGLNFLAVSQPIRFFTSTGNGTERVRIKNEGHVRFVPLSAAPTTNVEAGDVYYDSTTNKLRCYNGTSWNDLF